MAWFKKTADPISDRARALSQEIASLESQIKALDARLQHPHEAPKLRSTALPQGVTVSSAPDPFTVSAARAPSPEPVFEEVDQGPLNAHTDTPATAAHFNELGVRKYDLLALLRRWRDHFRGPSTTNPKLVSYLAAGGIQGLRPLRYEKRVARNRFIALVVILFVIMLGLIAAFYRR